MKNFSQNSRLLCEKHGWNEGGFLHFAKYIQFLQQGNRVFPA